MIEEIERQLDGSYEAETVISAMRKWRHEFKLDEDPRSPVEDYGSLVDALNKLTYLLTAAAESQDSPEFESGASHVSLQTSTEDDERSDVLSQDVDVSDANTG